MRIELHCDDRDRFEEFDTRRLKDEPFSVFSIEYQYNTCTSKVFDATTSKSTKLKLKASTTETGILNIVFQQLLFKAEYF